MNKLSKIALAAAMTLSLAGTATALAEASTTATAQHTAYVTLTITHEGGTQGEEATIEGSVPCQASTTERLVRAWMNRPACKHDAYAYAYPKDQPAPWEGELVWVNHTTHVTEDGQHRDTAHIVYRVLSDEPGQGVETVHATAGELRPEDRSDTDTPGTYSLPAPEPDRKDPGATLKVDLGPEPEPVRDGQPLGEGT